MPTTAPRRELFAWAMYDFANSGYTTVVLTTIFNAYFVGVVVGGAGGLPAGMGTLLWTMAVSIPNALVLVSAPVLGAIADHYAAKKRFLLITTIGCVLGTALLSLTGPGDVWLAIALVVLSNLTFSTAQEWPAKKRSSGLEVLRHAKPEAAASISFVKDHVTQGHLYEKVLPIGQDLVPIYNKMILAGLHVAELDE